jgi:hypothetical protein
MSKKIFFRVRKMYATCVVFSTVSWEKHVLSLKLVDGWMEESKNE